MEQNQMHSMVTESFGDQKLDRHNELNDTMSIAPKSPDAYTQKIHSLGGANNA